MSNGPLSLSGTGHVDDIAQEYRNALVVRYPIESSHGANIKLAEAVQYGCAALAAAHSPRGYEEVLTPDSTSRTMLSEAAGRTRSWALLDDESELLALP